MKWFKTNQLGKQERVEGRKEENSWLLFFFILYELKFFSTIDDYCLFIQWRKQCVCVGVCFPSFEKIKTS